MLEFFKNLFNDDYGNMRGNFNPETRTWDGPKVPYPIPLDMHIGEAVMNHLEANPNRIVQVSDDDGSEMTANELRIKIIRVAQNLTKLGIKDEDVVGLICQNSMDLMAFVNGIIQIGAVVNCFSPALDTKDLLRLYGNTKPKLVIANANVYAKVKNVLEELYNKAQIYITNGKIDGIPSVDELLKPTGNEENYQNLKFENPQSKMLAILASSGSTGPPKGVCLPQAFFAKFMTIPPWDKDNTRTLSFEAVFWGSVFRGLILAALTNHSRVMSTKPYSPEHALDMASKWKVTCMNLNPPKWTLLLQSEAIKSFDSSNVTVNLTMGGHFTEDLRQKMMKFFPKAYFMIFYGMTEISASYTYPDQILEEYAAGFVAPNHSIKIVDDDENSLNPGQQGEILVKHDYTPFLGYYNCPKATEEAVDTDGFFKSGDIGYIKEDGTVFVIDRKKYIFKYCGYQINPSEIESVIQTMEEVEFVTVFGIPNVVTYNLTAAMIKKKKEFEKLSEEEVIEYVAERLPEIKHLHGGVFFTEEMPMTKTGKISKRVAKEIAMKILKERQTRESKENWITQEKDFVTFKKNRKFL